MIYEKWSLEGGAATHTYWSTLFEMLWHSQQPSGQQLKKGVGGHGLNITKE